MFLTTVTRGVFMTNIRTQTLLWIAIVIFLPGCAVREILDVPTQAQLSQVEKSRVFPNNYDAVWAATTKSLVIFGVSIQSQDKSSGNISTDWILEKEAIGVFTTGSRFKASVLIEKKSSSSTLVTVIPIFEIRVSDKANWQPGGRKNNHKDVEKKLLDAIQSNLESTPNAVAVKTPVTPAAIVEPTSQPVQSSPNASSQKMTVQQVQKRLSELGYQPGPSDGKMGKNTVEALKKFQKDNNLAITGQTTDETIAKLLQK